MLPPKPLPLPACTGMLEQSAILMRQATVYANGEMFEKVSALARQSTSLMKDAFACAERAANPSATDLAEWRRVMDDWRSQQAVADSLMRAKNAN